VPPPAEVRTLGSFSPFLEECTGGFFIDFTAAFRIRSQRVTLSPYKILKEGIKAVPAVRYALGVAAIAAIIAIVSGFIKDFRVAILGTILMLGLMSALVVFSSLARTAAKDVRPLALVLAWGSVVLIIATSVLIFTGFFFQWPRPLDRYVEAVREKTTLIPPAAVPSPSPPSAAANRLATKKEEPGITPNVRNGDPSPDPLFSVPREIWPNLEGGWSMKWGEKDRRVVFFNDGQYLRCKEVLDLRNINGSIYHEQPCSNLTVDSQLRIHFSFGGSEYVGNIEKKSLKSMSGVIVSPSGEYADQWVMTK
jgi:hypothetical protein